MKATYPPKFDPKGCHVSMQWKGRTLLGEVVERRYDEFCGCVRLTVRHFCGDLWPIEPTLLAVDFLPRR